MEFRSFRTFISCYCFDFKVFTEVPIFWFRLPYHDSSSCFCIYLHLVWTSWAYKYLIINIDIYLTFSVWPYVLPFFANSIILKIISPFWASFPPIQLFALIFPLSDDLTFIFPISPLIILRLRVICPNCH